MKYRKKPVVVEALQFTGDNHEEILSFGNETFKQPFYSKTAKGFKNPIIVIDTLEGQMKITKGDFVIKDIKGEYYLCKEEIFKSI